MNSGNKTISPGDSIARSRPSQADRLASAINNGHPVAPSTLRESGRELVGQLSSPVPSMRNAARNNIPQIYHRMEDRRDRGELLGWLVGAGSAAREIFDAIDDASEEVVKVCRDILGLPPPERVATLATLLAIASRSAPPSRVPSPQDVHIELAATDPRRREGEDAAEPPSDLDLLLNAAMPESTRLEAMKRLSPNEAGAALEVVLRRPDPRECEFGSTAAIHLGRGGAREAIARLVEKLASESSLRRYVNEIERALSGDDRDAGGMHRRGPSGSGAADVGAADGWLARALASCDGPNILSASAGREHLVIPRILRRYAEVTSVR